MALGSQLLGKPEDADHARRMLSGLSGSTHTVVTGVALVAPANGIETVDHVISTVTMRTLSPAEIAAYVAGGQWSGKAGGYGIQDDDPFVTCMNGPVSNVVGLPVERVLEMFKSLPFEIDAADANDRP